MMKPDPTIPLSRPVAVDRLPSEGTEIVVTATAEERERLARDFDLPAIHALEGRFILAGSAARVRVRGRVTAAVRQTCVVTLDPFEGNVDEEVEVDFTAPDHLPKQVAEEVERAPTQDEIISGQIDLGRVTSEFLALGLDPYPRKPGVAFSFEPEGEPEPSPFAALDRLKRP